MTNFGPSAVLARERLLSPTQRPGIIYTIDDDDVDAIDDDDVDAKDDDYVDETFPDVRQGKGKERARGLVSAASSEFGSDSMSMDEEFMEQLDQVEMKALSQAPLPGPSSSSWRVGPRLRSRVLSGTSMDVITIDDDEDDKENVSLSARRTRRRTDRDLQAVGQEVIDVSDSD
jgi:hypothetical protein